MLLIEYFYSNLNELRNNQVSTKEVRNSVVWALDQHVSDTSVV